jgi:adenosylmethionine-8-amino-7-oxononanoate aminotransferase
VLEILTRESLVERSATMGALLAARLDAVLGDHPNVQEIRGRALFQGVELVRDRDTGAPFPAAAKFASAVVTECLARDMWVYPAGSGPVQDAVMIGCPFIITEAEIEQIVVTLRDGIDAAARLV